MPLTSLSFLEVGQPWPPKDEEGRLSRYLSNRNLFKGRHELEFNQWFRLIRGDQQATLEIILNWPKRLSTLWADLIVGEPPRFSVGERESANQERLMELLTDMQYNTTLYEGIIDISRYGDAVFKTSLRDGKAEVSVQAPYYWFPVVSQGDARKIQQHVLAFTYDRMEKSPLYRREQKVTYLKAEIHDKGSIEHRLYRLENSRLRDERSDSSQMREDFPDLPGELRDGRIVEETGVEDFLIQHAPGLRGSDDLFGSDDYTDIDGILQEAEVRLSQISRVLDEHADPKMYGPPAALRTDPVTGETVFVSGGQYFPVTDTDSPPGYIVWQAALAEGFQLFSELVEQFYLVSETSPAAFGKLDVGLATSGTALRRLMQAPLAKAARIKMRLDPVARRVLELAAELEDANSSERGAPIEGLQATWNDGLPDDENEQTTIEATRVAGGFGSKFSAIKRIDGVDDEQAEAEMERIREEASAEAAPVEVEANGTAAPPSRLAAILAAQPDNQSEGEAGGNQSGG